MRFCQYDGDAIILFSEGEKKTVVISQIGLSWS